MNSFTIPHQSHWSDCQYCTYSNSGSHTGLYWHRVMEQTYYVFAFWPVIHAHRLRFVYFSVCTLELYFISPLHFHAPGSTIILCSFTHLFPSSLLMLPVVHRGAGSAPKTGWITMMVSVLSSVPVPPQSKDSTASSSSFSLSLLLLLLSLLFPLCHCSLLRFLLFSISLV